MFAVALAGLACAGGAAVKTPVPLATYDGANHIEPGELYGAYSTVPATSGPHWSTQPVDGAPLGAPVKWGIYEQPIPDEALVHNLEHGGIGLHYNCADGCPDLVRDLTSLVPANPSQYVVAPYPGMRAVIAVTAWRRVMYLDGFDAEAIRSFIAAYQDRAPESLKGDLF